MQIPDPIRSVQADRLVVRIYRTRDEMARAAAAAAAGSLGAAIAARGEARVMFASAPSQVEFLHALADARTLDWSRVTAFQLDEYLDFPSQAPQAFGQFLREHLFDRTRPRKVWFLDGTARDAAAEIARYERLLREAKLDLGCVGVGENGHLAFNEPDSTDFDDPALLRVVALTEESRRQQVHDGCFDALDAVPTRAMTLTVPAIVAARTIVCIVPGPTKREALSRMVRGAVSVTCPASVLQRHADATVFADVEAASAL